MEKAFGMTLPEIHKELNETQSKYRKPAVGMMKPAGLAMKHPAGPLLESYANDGCPVEVDATWTLQQLDDAVAYGAHPSAQDPVAAKACRTEALEKVHEGHAKLIKYSALRAAVARGDLTAKISPIAAIPHKSRAFRMLLDLSPKGQGREPGKTPRVSVNDATNRDAAPLAAMDQLGKVMPRIIFWMASQPLDEGPILFSKFDIKDGFWRVGTDPAKQHEFCYALPPAEDDDPSDPLILVPSALQMGWTSSPPFFCAATETGRDIADTLVKASSLPDHPMVDATLDPEFEPLLRDVPHPSTWDTDALPEIAKKLNHLFEVFVDDYIGCVQSTDVEVLRQAANALLHAIHQIFPPPAAMGTTGEDPVSQKKLLIDKEGVWAARKEILGWLCDGAARTIELPDTKVEAILDLISSAIRHKQAFPVPKFRSLVGKLVHASMGIPLARPLLHHLYKQMKAVQRFPNRKVKLKADQVQALKDFRSLLHIMTKRPTLCRQLIMQYPSFIGYCDACKYGAGGVWLAGSKSLHPIVWRLKWPPSIVDMVKDDDNPDGTLTINELEMAGVLLHYLHLEALLDLKDEHVAIWSDNMSAVAWTCKQGSSLSRVGQCLARALATRINCNESSPLAAAHIAGKLNGMADLASRTFRHQHGPGNYDIQCDATFLNLFNASFPLNQQESSWRSVRLRNSWTSRVISLMLTEPSHEASWVRLPAYGLDIGITGSTTAKIDSLTWTRYSKTPANVSNLRCSSALPNTYDAELVDEDIKSALARFKTRSAPSARKSSWLN